MGAVVGSALAFAAAAAGDGLVWFFDQDWVWPADPGRTIWAGG
ncbi:hypothetical protein ABZV58_11300 [Nocardia sp. NPDC004654]